MEAVSSVNFAMQRHWTDFGRLQTRPTGDSDQLRKHSIHVSLAAAGFALPSDSL